MAGIYIHIPFCRQACIYCNFHFSTSLKLKRELINALKDELILQQNFLQGSKIETIYFGGGTPSLLSAAEINEITETIYKHYNVDSLAEFTFEANPDDLTRDYLTDLNKTAVDRLSIGIQSFRQQDLARLHRAHTLEQAELSIRLAQDAEYSNLSIDLIYGINGLLEVDWIENLNKLSSFKIPHFSAYSLTVEPKTALYHAIKTQKAAHPDAEIAANQFLLLMDWAQQNGYEHYEISNFATKGKRAIHNTNYWLGVPYIGIGPGAHSFDGTIRRWNISNNIKYIQGIEAAGKREIPVHSFYEEEKLTIANKINEYILTSLRTIWGTDLVRIGVAWGNFYRVKIENIAKQFVTKGWLKSTNNTLILTTEGKLFADKIASDLFVDG